VLAARAQGTGHGRAAHGSAAQGCARPGTGTVAAPADIAALGDVPAGAATVYLSD